MSYFTPRRGVGLALALSGIDFNPGSVWSDWVAGAAGNNAAGKRAGQAIQAGLNEIGYGPIAVDGQFGQGSISAWGRFARDNGVAANWPTQPGVIKLGEKLSEGGNQGGGGVVESHKVGDQYVPGSDPAGTKKAGMGTMLGLGLAVIVGVGLLAIASKKKGGPPQRGSTSTSASAELKV